MFYVSEFNCFPRSRCSMEMWCPDDKGRDSWDWVGPPAWERACFNSPEWGGGSSPVKTQPPKLYYCCCCLVVVLFGGGGSDTVLQRRVCPGLCTLAPNYGGRVPVDTTPGPTPVCRALKKSTPRPSETARDALPPAIPALTRSLQAHNCPSGPYRP